MNIGNAIESWVPLYDPLTKLVGLGNRFRRKTVDFLDLKEDSKVLDFVISFRENIKRK